MRIVPDLDMARHLIEGTPIRNQGVGIVPQPDPVEIHDPMSMMIPGSGNFDGNPSDVVSAINLANGAGLMSDRADLGQSMINMEVASDCMDEETKGGLEYGPRNTGSY